MQFALPQPPRLPRVISATHSPPYLPGCTAACHYDTACVPHSACRLRACATLLLLPAACAVRRALYRAPLRACPTATTRARPAYLLHCLPFTACTASSPGFPVLCTTPPAVPSCRRLGPLLLPCLRVLLPVYVVTCTVRFLLTRHCMLHTCTPFFYRSAFPGLLLPAGQFLYHAFTLWLILCHTPFTHHTQLRFERNTPIARACHVLPCTPFCTHLADCTHRLFAIHHHTCYIRVFSAFLYLAATPSPAITAHPASSATTAFSILDLDFSLLTCCHLL